MNLLPCFNLKNEVDFKVGEEILIEKQNYKIIKLAWIIGENKLDETQAVRRITVEKRDFDVKWEAESD